MLRAPESGGSNIAATPSGTADGPVTNPGDRADLVVDGNCPHKKPPRKSLGGEFLYTILIKPAA